MNDFIQVSANHGEFEVAMQPLEFDNLDWVSLQLSNNCIFQVTLDAGRVRLLTPQSNQNLQSNENDNHDLTGTLTVSNEQELALK